MTIQQEFNDRIEWEKDDIIFYLDIIRKASEAAGSDRALSRQLDRGETYIANAVARKKITNLKEICRSIIDKKILI